MKKLILAALITVVLAIAMRPGTSKAQGTTLIKHSKATAVVKKAVVKPVVIQTPTPAPKAVPTAPVAVTAPIAPITTSSASGCTQYASLFEQYDWNVDTAEAICMAESSGIANRISDPALNWDDLPDYGLMQLHNVDILDPAQNIAYAYYHKYLTQGWEAWSTYNSGVYKEYL